MAAETIQLPLAGLADVTSDRAPADKHFFVPDGHGYYCQACGLPRRNQRHVAGERVK